ncbi:MAG: Transglycosylase-associated protein [Chthoniobacteraceae bacterium]|nr:Transglycosylase-associated protein [Chthoniobacteraceae bacterium]
MPTNDAHPTGALSGPDSIVTMGIIASIIIGLIVGAIAKFLMPGRDPGGWIITILLGLAGSILAGFLGRSLNWYKDGEPAGFLASIIGAILILVIYRLVTKRNV